MAQQDTKTQLLQAALAHVPFEGWTETTFKAAIEDSGMEASAARTACPRGAVDLAVAYHLAGDQVMLDHLAEANLSEFRFRDRIATAVRLRLEAVEDKELVRRGMALFALPHHAGEGAQLTWGTCDKIWTALGDSSNDINWYTKRATLSGVYGSTVLYWLGDDSAGHTASWDFLDRRIENVMQFETFKAKARENRLLSGLMAGPLAVLGRIKAPSDTQQAGMPGRWSGPK